MKIREKFTITVFNIWFNVLQKRNELREKIANSDSSGLSNRDKFIDDEAVVNSPWILDEIKNLPTIEKKLKYLYQKLDKWGAFDRAKNHKRQRRKRQSVTAKREKSQTPKFV